MYMYVYVYMYVCVHVCIYIYMRSLVGVHIHSCRRILVICTVQSLYYMRVYHRCVLTLACVCVGEQKFWSHRSTSTQPPIILPLRLSHEGFKLFLKPRNFNVFCFVCCFVLLNRYWGIVTVPGSFLKAALGRDVTFSATKKSSLH